MAASDKVKDEIKNLIEVSSHLEVRLLEIIEFEKQWNNLFSKLSPNNKTSIQIRISNRLLLRSYRYDKFHIICDDLLSILENQITNSNSACQISVKELYVDSIQHFESTEKLTNFDITTIDAQTNEVITVDSKEDSERHFLERIFAVEKRRAHLEVYESLFGSGETENEKWSHLKNKLSTLASEVKGLRNLFSHRYFESIQNKHRARWEDLTIEKHISWFRAYFDIVQKLQMLVDSTFHKGIKIDLRRNVSDQIDIILFGSIGRCVEIYLKDHHELDYYEARESYFNSSKVKELIASDKS